MRILVCFSYDGSNFYGMQMQPDLRTVEGEFRKALKIINKKETPFIFASRTDKGVHAKRAYAHFDIDIDIPVNNLKRALNSLLPKDIYVKSIKKVSNEFHARYNKAFKTYKYYLDMGEYNPFRRNYITYYHYKIDINIIKKNIKKLIGEHNFYYFASPSEVKNSYIRTIKKANLKVDGKLLTFTFTGDGFHKYMVRNMVGTLLKLGRGLITEEEFDSLLTKDSSFNYVFTAPPEGLYLENIKYIENC